MEIRRCRPSLALKVAAGVTVTVTVAFAVAFGVNGFAGGGSQSGRVGAPAAAAPAQKVPAPVALPSWTLPTPNAGFDYQLGGAYPAPANVEIVARDRTDPPAAGLYNVCYVNGFQTQPGERQWWLDTHPTLLLREFNGDPVIDPEWPDEYILDVSTPANRSAIAAIVGPWITGCDTDGYQAVEIDNLDTYTRFSSHLTENDAIAMVTSYAGTAHTAGLAIAQKNSAELAPRLQEAGLDFAIAEECSQFDECDVYTAAYGDRVLVIEYKQAAFTQACTDFANLSIVLRDRDLATPSNSGYLRDAC